MRSFKSKKVNSKKSVNAILSKAAYNRNPEEYIKSQGLNLRVDKSLSGKDWTTFVDPTTNKATVAYRGTNPKNWRDLTTDVMIGLGLEGISSRFKRSKNVAKKVKEKYGDATLTGHSLGGSLALYAGKKQKLRSEVYNPGMAKPWYTNKKSTIYATVGDPINNISTINPLIAPLLKSRIRVEVPKGAIWNPLSNHSIDQFAKEIIQEQKPAAPKTSSDQVGYSAQ